jgi:hypothetical protein
VAGEDAVGRGVIVVTTRSGRGTAWMLTETADTVVLLLEFGPSATVPVALVVTVNQRVPEVWGRITCWVRCTAPPTAMVPVKVKLPSSVGLCPWASVAV